MNQPNQLNQLVNKLFSAPQSNAINSLINNVNNSEQFLIQKEIGKKILDNNEILNHPIEQIIAITTISPFSSSIEECSEVASIIFWGLKKTNILPMITIYKGKELAYRCFISLSLYKNVMIKRWEKYGAPSPDFYRCTGVAEFNMLGMLNISRHFKQWEYYLNEMFV